MFDVFRAVDGLDLVVGVVRAGHLDGDVANSKNVKLNFRFFNEIISFKIAPAVKFLAKNLFESPKMPS